MKLALTLPLVALVLAIGCGKSTDLPKPDAPPDTDWCRTMCDHLFQLGCEEGDDVYNSDLPGTPGVPNQGCREFCEDLQNKGLAVNPRCVAQVDSCDQIEDYRERVPESCR